MKIKEKLFEFLSTFGDLGFTINGETKVRFKIGESAAVDSLGAIIPGTYGCIKSNCENDDEDNLTSAEKLLGLVEHLELVNTKEDEDYAGKFHHSLLIEGIINALRYIKEERVTKAVVKLEADNIPFFYMEIELLTNSYCTKLFSSSQSSEPFVIQNVDENTNITVLDEDGGEHVLKPKVDFNHTYYLYKHNNTIENGDVVFIIKDNDYNVLIITPSNNIVTINGK